MIVIRKSHDRGHFNHGWLDTYHTFSFGDYIDPNYTHFRSLRVINQDIVKPHTGFNTHAHHDMEIITYVLKGEVTHQDSMGNKTVIKPNEIQYMSAGTSIQHSEHNLGDTDLELLQIWVLPNQKNLTPHYEQLKFTPPDNNLLQHKLNIHQDIKIFTGILNKDQLISYSGQYIWIQLISGELEINNNLLSPGDGCAISHENNIVLKSRKETHFLLFDLGQLTE